MVVIVNITTYSRYRYLLIMDIIGMPNEGNINRRARTGGDFPAGAKSESLRFRSLRIRGSAGLVLVFLQFLQVLRPFLEGDLLFVILYRPSNFT